MQLAAAILCDFASVRENLLNVVGGGITRIRRESFPARLGINVALMLELHRMELGRPHELQVLIQDQDGQELAEILGGFNVGTADIDPGESVLVPIPFDLRDVGIPAPGALSVEISIDGTHYRSLRVRVAPGELPGH